MRAKRLAGSPPPDDQGRVDRIDRRTVALKRKDAKGDKATTTVPDHYVTSRPLEVVQIDHTEVDVGSHFGVRMRFQENHDLIRAP